MKRFLFFANLRWLLEAITNFLLVLFVGVLPRRLSLMTGEFIGLCLFFISSNRRRIALKNIEIAQKGRLILSTTPIKTVREHFISLGRSLSELAMLSWGRDAILKDIEFEGFEHYKKAKAKGKGVILITGHCGNWELLAIAFSWKGFTSSIVARHLNNPYLDKFVETLRTRFGNRMIYKSGALKEIVRLLREGGDVGILIDQSVTENEAVITEFFDEKVYSMKMPALLAIKTGAAVVPAFINYIGNGRHRIRVCEELKLRVTGILEDDAVFNTGVFMNCVEKYIRENQSEWLWIHRRWKLSHGRRY